MSNELTHEPLRITLIGAGTIGLSFAALHLTKDPHCLLTVHDNRPDLESYVTKELPKQLVDVEDPTPYFQRITYDTSLSSAVQNADIIQEQGPENADFKTALWPKIEAHAPPNALLWSSTSGIPASTQSAQMHSKTRLLVVHPFNPAAIMPILELVPSPTTSPSIMTRTLEFWRARGRTPIVVKKECTGFVANRLAFALLREACSLVANGVVGVEDLDALVTASMGPRWAVAGPFKSYHAGGGEGGLKSFLEKIGGTVQGCWDASDEDVRKANIKIGEAWQEEICRQAAEAYGVTDTAERDRKTRKVLEAVQD